MKKVMKWLTVLCVVVMTMFGTKADAQTVDCLSANCDHLQTYTVIRGTTMWDLSTAMYGNGWEWQSMFEQNIRYGYLDSTRLRYRNGRPIVILSVGEIILLNRYDAAHASSLVTSVPNTVEPQSYFPWGLWLDAFLWLVVGLMISMLWALFRNSRRHLANPETSGPPMREGGVSDETVASRFQEMASNATGNPGQTTYTPPEQIRVVNIRRGRGYGQMLVRYRGREKPELKRLNGEVVYRATVEFPDRRQEEMYCLQACANDLTYQGTRYSTERFRFVDENISIPVPPAKTTVHAGNTSIGITDEEITFTDHGRSTTIPLGGDWSISPRSDGGYILAERGRTKVEIVGGRVRGAKLPEHKHSSKPSKVGDQQ